MCSVENRLHSQGGASVTHWKAQWKVSLLTIHRVQNPESLAQEPAFNLLSSGNYERFSETGKYIITVKL